MRLTPIGKLFITLVILSVIVLVAYRKYGDEIRTWAGAEVAGATSKGTAISKEDFNKIAAGLSDAPGGGAGPVRPSGAIGEGALNRPLRVGINTWAGHAPGIVANGGMSTAAASTYKKKYGLEVEFKLIEDPSQKLAAFLAGDIDIMWDTVDSFSREASLLAERGMKAKAIIQQDWSRGGDGIVALKSITSVEGLKGKRIATTKYTPSHWLLLYLTAQSGLSPQDRADIEKKLVFTDEAPKAAAMFKAGQVDAAVTWEPDLSGAVSARPNDAHILISTTAATHVIADTLVASERIIQGSPKAIQDFVAGWFDGMATMEADPEGTNALVGKALKLAPEDVSGMLSGLKLTPFADNAMFFGLSGEAHPHFDALFNGAFVIWRKMGVVTTPVDAKDFEDGRFVASLAKQYGSQKVVETFKFSDRPDLSQQAIVQKSVTIHFATASAEIENASTYTLDGLGESMLALGNTYVEIIGNTDSRGSQDLNKALSQRRAESVRAYLMQHFKVDAKRVIAVGKGSSNPVASNENEEGRALNRRTDIRVLLNAN